MGLNAYDTPNATIQPPARIESMAPSPEKTIESADARKAELLAVARVGGHDEWFDNLRVGRIPGVITDLEEAIDLSQRDQNKLGELLDNLRLHLDNSMRYSSMPTPAPTVATVSRG